MMSVPAYLEVIAGSRCYGLNIEGSDTDLCRVADSWNTTGHEGPYHVIQMPRTEFVDRCMLRRDTPLYIQWWFPAQVVTPGVVWPFLQARRERLVWTARRRVWETHRQAAESLMLYPEHYYSRFPKRLAYSALFWDTLARYAAGAPFAQAIRPEEEMRQKLLAIRRQELTLSEAVSLCREAQGRALASKCFYDAPQDLAALAETEAELKDLLGL